MSCVDRGQKADSPWTRDSEARTQGLCGHTASPRHAAEIPTGSGGRGPTEPGPTHHPYVPNTKLSGLKIWPKGPDLTESMVPGSRSTRMARGTYLLPVGTEQDSDLQAEQSDNALLSVPLQAELIPENSSKRQRGD